MNKQIIVCLIFIIIKIVHGNDYEKWMCNDQNKCFRLMSGHRGPYENTDRYCNQIGGRAVVINSLEEQKFLEKYLQSLRFNSSVWIGGTRQNTNFAWRNDGRLIKGDVYSNWAPNHPTNFFAKACMVMKGLSDSEPGKWIEDFCFESHDVVCQRSSKTNNNDNEVIDNHYDNQCCDRVKNYMEELEENLEKFDEKFDEINERMNNLNNNINKFRRKIETFTEKINRFENNLNIEEISNNFTGITNVLNYYSQELNSIRSEANNRYPSTDVDLAIVKRELIDYFEEQFKQANFDDVVNDIKLSYVNFRRALMKKQNGRWVTLGYV